MERLSKTHLFVVDDLGLAPLADTKRRDLLEVIEDRHGTNSTLIAASFPWKTGMITSVIQRSQMRYWTG